MGMGDIWKVPSSAAWRRNTNQSTELRYARHSRTRKLSGFSNFLVFHEQWHTHVGWEEPRPVHAKIYPAVRLGNEAIDTGLNDTFKIIWELCREVAQKKKVYIETVDCTISFFHVSHIYSSISKLLSLLFFIYIWSNIRRLWTSQDEWRATLNATVYVRGLPLVRLTYASLGFITTTIIYDR
jgi:hypothetical protein